MDCTGSVSRCLNQCKAGDPDAARPLWERYFDRLARLADRELRGLLAGAFDGEDVALSAFDSFFRALAQGRYHGLEGREELWALLRTILRHKVLDRVKALRRAKRDPNRVQGAGDDVERLEGREPDPGVAVLMAEECRRLLDGLGEDRLREIALLKVEGHTDEEVAAKLDCGLRTVQRKLERIRCKWAKEIR
jgi:DNA-directed RNA polymerase specialized sigma24 family protein